MGFLDKIADKFRNMASFAIDGEIWAVAFRRTPARRLWEGEAQTPFIFIPNNTRWWRADPFIFKHDGTNYLFVEMFDRWKNKGVIAVAILRNGQCGSFKVCLDLPYHLSYPCVYEKDGEIFMLPEYGRSGGIHVFKAKEFPLKWESYRILRQGIMAADTTPLFDKNNKIKSFFATIHKNGSIDNDNLHLMAADGTWLRTLYEGNLRVRPGGNIIRTKTGLVRPAQDSVLSYGNHLVFYDMDSCDTENYTEHERFSVFAPGRKAQSPNMAVRFSNQPKGIDFVGLHTYNGNEDYEVLDVSYNNPSNSIVFLKKLRHHLAKRLGLATINHNS